MNDKTSQQDPVCGMAVTPDAAAGALVHAGRTYLFCSAHCLAKFRAEPGKFLACHAAASPRQASTARYTCPMHPQIVQQGHGSCPICGMDLEPVDAAAEAEESPDLRKMTQRFRVMPRSPRFP